MKKKINKKFLARIGALLACVLLVGALVVPCFADYTPSHYPYDDEWDAYLRYKESYWLYDLFGTGSNGNRAYYQSRITENFDQWFNGNSVDALISGVLPHTNTGYGASNLYNTAGGGVNLRTTIYSVVCLVAFDSVSNNTIFSVSTNANVSVTLYPSYYSLSFSYDGDIYGFNYEIDDAYDTATLSYLYGGGETFSKDIGGADVFDDIEISLYMAISDPTEVSLLNNITFLLFGDERVNATGDLKHIAFPQAEYRAARQVFDKMKETAFEQEQSAYDSGLGVSYNTGFQDGYDEAKAEIDSSRLTYEAGYNDALSEISSGEFGENLLGNMFSAPIKAVQSITLVQLPNGSFITLGNIFSALIALLLVLAFIKIYSR